MQLMTYNEALTSICDFFDSLITPKAITRSNANIAYLMFKAVAKGFEVINNVCVVLSNKFDPMNCSEEDLVSVAELVGTEKMKGSASGLVIVVSNPSSESILLRAGFYEYDLDADTKFVFEVIDDNNYIASGDSQQFLAFSEAIGTFPVTEQASIIVEPEAGLELDVNLTFSCLDNSSLLGTPEETNIELRQRINTDTTRQDTIVELEELLKKQPYIFDAKICFNDSLQETTYDNYVIPPYYMAIFFSGAPRNEIAELIASKGIFPTLASEASSDSEGEPLTEESVALSYVNDVFSSGTYAVNIIPFKKKHYRVKVTYKYDVTYVSYYTVQNQIKAWLKAHFRPNLHSDYVTESDIIDSLKSMNLANVEFLNVDILDKDGDNIPYLSVPRSSIPYLDDAEFERITENV